MRQGRRVLALCAALALGVAAGSSALTVPSVAEAAAGSAAKSAKPKNALRQFTGIVSALDKTTLTVEKRGKSPRIVVFTKHAEMKTTGNVEKNARVTVYYREEDGGRSIAHRVVVKPERPRRSGGKS